MTGPDGRFSFAGIPQRKQYFFRARAEGYLTLNRAISGKER